MMRKLLAVAIIVLILGILMGEFVIPYYERTWQAHLRYIGGGIASTLLIGAFLFAMDWAMKLTTTITKR